MTRPIDTVIDLDPPVYHPDLGPDCTDDDHRVYRRLLGLPRPLMQTYTTVFLQYRDADNYKYRAEFNLEGELDVETLRPCLSDSEYLIVGNLRGRGFTDLPDPRDAVDTAFPTAGDHVYTEVTGTRVFQSAEPCPVVGSADDFLAACRQEDWGAVAEMARLGLPA